MLVISPFVSLITTGVRSAAVTVCKPIPRNCAVKIAHTKVNTKIDFFIFSS